MTQDNDMEALRKVAEEATNSDHDGRFAFRQAATPQVVLALLSELEAVKGERDGWRRLCGDHQTAQDAAEAALVSLKGGGGSSCTNLDGSPSGATDGLCKSEGEP